MSTEELKDLTVKAAEEFYLKKDNGINILIKYMMKC